jgi:elongation factor 3
MKLCLSGYCGRTTQAFDSHFHFIIFLPCTMPLLEAPVEIVNLVRESLPLRLTQDVDNEHLMTYLALLAKGLASQNNFDPVVWEETMTPYLTDYLPTENRNNGQEQEDNVIYNFCLAAQKALTDEDDNESYGDPDEDAEELCDLRFNLAYGGKILLHKTKMRLLRGRRYALVGTNGVGKTTLMNAICNNKLDGWPTHLKTAYVDSGSNVDPVFERQNVLEHLQRDTGKTKEECLAKLLELDFTETMAEGTIGALSGGWQMKLRLIRAVLMDPDIYLLDEPTNHLSSAAVVWVTDYLLGLTHQTVLIVSHDTNFLENVVSDVIHYEQRPIWGPYRRLVHYKGKMSDFVKLQPQAKHYFELATTDNLNFNFPEPGRLEGVRTSTQKFLEMEHVDFKYAGAKENTLTDINLKMTLSSRIVVLGANGTCRLVVRCHLYLWLDSLLF